MRQGTPPYESLSGADGWQQIDFLSDVHLHADDEPTFSSWRRYLQGSTADAIFILGDLFDVWIGDDILAAVDAVFENRCVQTLHAAAQNKAVFLLRGNRDFLLGAAFEKAARVRLLSDPVRLEFASQGWLLSHGDALCLTDQDYLAFRTQVRSPAWQLDFLARPLRERRQIARSMRAQSEAHKRQSTTLHDPDAAASVAWLQGAHASTLIHGHTHRPAEHALGAGLRRVVLSDWDAMATPARAEVLRLSLATPGRAATVKRLNLANLG